MQLPGGVIQLSAPLLWLDELPDGRILATTLFYKDTPDEQTNAFVYDSTGTMETEIRIEDNGRLVRILGSEVENGEITILGANDTKYTLDPVGWAVTRARYYR